MLTVNEMLTLRPVTTPSGTGFRTGRSAIPNAEVDYVARQVRVERD